MTDNTVSNPRGFMCECGKYHEFGVYVAAHWDILLTHKCSECKRRHHVLKGTVTLLGRADPFAAAFRKGRAAAHARRPRESNPYKDIRKLDGRLTFGRAWRKEWFRGYDETRDKLVAKGIWMTGVIAHMVKRK